MSILDAFSVVLVIISLLNKLSPIPIGLFSLRAFSLVPNTSIFASFISLAIDF